MMEFLDMMLYQSKVPSVDVWDKNGKVDGNEQDVAIYKGVVSLHDPEVQEVMKIIKDWSVYWGRGFNSLDRQQAKALFATGKGAIYMDGSWELEGLAKAVDFELGVFPVPVLTKETSKYADGPYRDYNYNLNFAVSKACERRGNLDLAIDFLRFFTSPEAAKIMEKHAYFISALKGVEVGEKMKDFAPITEGGLGFHPWYVSQSSGSTESSDRLFSLLQRYLTDEITLSEMVNLYEPLYLKLTREEIEFSISENAKRIEATRTRIESLKKLLEEAEAAGDAEKAEAIRRRIRWYTASMEKARSIKAFLEKNYRKRA